MDAFAAALNDLLVNTFHSILKLEEDITKALIKDWKKYDVYGAVKC